MKTKYLKGITALGFIALLSFSACLKDDTHYFNPEATQSTIVELVNSGLANFGHDAVTAAGLDTISFGVDIAQLNPLATATTVVIGVDNTIVTSYDAANPAINYLTIPSTAYTLPATNITIPAGSNYVIAKVIINRNLLDPTQSYMLPVRIVSASGLAISANNYVHYFHIIGNDFAGSYTHDFIRIPAANFIGHTDTFFPDSPTQFEVYGGYYTATVRYVVSFTKTGTGASASYSNWAIALNSGDVASILTANGISVSANPVILAYVPGTSYTFAQSVALFGNNTDNAGGFQWGANGTRINTDYYHH